MDFLEDRRLFFLWTALSRRLTAAVIVNPHEIGASQVEASTAELRELNAVGYTVDEQNKKGWCEELQQKTEVSTACTFNYLNFGLVFWDVLPSVLVSYRNCPVQTFVYRFSRNMCQNYTLTWCLLLNTSPSQCLLSFWVPRIVRQPLLWALAHETLLPSSVPRRCMRPFSWQNIL